MTSESPIFQSHVNDHPRRIGLSSVRSIDAKTRRQSHGRSTSRRESDDEGKIAKGTRLIARYKTTVTALTRKLI